MAEYPNRSDLRNPATRKVAFTGQTYGEAAQQARSQQAVSPGSAPEQVAAQQAAAAQRQRPVSLTAPTQRPNEPITAGADFGAGPNSSTVGIAPRMIPVDNVMETLRVLYQMYPNDGLAEMLSKYGNKGY
jgi:hypothetical protein